ncbi:MAG: chemotaxis protein CheB [Chitinophagaceae bacterium]
MEEQNEQALAPKSDDQYTENRIIVIGASAGGFNAIQKLISALPPGFPASIFIVWHMSPEIRGVLPLVLNKLNTVPASQAYDGEPILPNHIYVAAPDRHMILEKGRIRITKGPRENRFRPAVDPLFRSAAMEYGDRVIGVVLTGALDDGTSGLWTIQNKGGICIVQDPLEAEVPSMPKSAMKEVDVDYCQPLLSIADTLVQLSNDHLSDHKSSQGMQEEERTKLEVAIAAKTNALKAGILDYGRFSAFSCPDCHGVLSEYKEGDRARYRCHTGHAFSANGLLSALTENIEKDLYNAIRAMEESIVLLNMEGDNFAEKNNPHLAAVYFQKATEAEERLQLVRQAAFQNEQLSIGIVQNGLDPSGESPKS